MLPFWPVSSGISRRKTEARSTGREDAREHQLLPELALRTDDWTALQIQLVFMLCVVIWRVVSLTPLANMSVSVYVIYVCICKILLQ